MARDGGSWQQFLAIPWRKQQYFLHMTANATGSSDGIARGRGLYGLALLYGS
jgi:hypothetical protein